MTSQASSCVLRLTSRTICKGRHRLLFVAIFSPRVRCVF
ncbi:hypothetical protein QC763_0091200 [Podospora pseudopauciseta]|uniref:Uncharacterized protein n=1 Tax=Podospora pseudopauciseta TaxID=2093780 RepID=A0ABR0H4B8_9PEZI|nr:hypothetical protein QC763_0091200 [Podospora pseudopauciseta]